MGVTYKELSAWVTAIFLVVVYGAYLAEASGATTVGSATSLVVRSALLFTVGLVVAMGLVRLFRRPERQDERDQLIATRAYRNAYFVATTGVAVAFLQLMGVQVAGPLLPAAKDPAITIHILILTLVAAELTNAISRIVYYRRGG